MSDKLPELVAQYTDSLQDYLAGAGEAALLRAHVIGREAVANGLDVLGMAEIHHQLLLAVLLRTPMVEESVQMVKRFAEFFMENLSIFAMMERGYMESSNILRQSNETLDHSNSFIEKVIATVPCSLLVIEGLSGKILVGNRIFCEEFLVAVEDIAGKQLDDVLSLIGLPHEANKTIISNHDISRLECRCDSSQVGERILTVSKTPLRMVDGEKIFLVIEDITERKRFEQEMARLERLNIVGEMAASIGHEVRNPLTTVRGYLQLFQRKYDNGNYREQLKTMIEELDRANAIISDFLSLAKNKVVNFKCYNLNDVIKSLLPLLQAEAYRTGRDIEVQLGKVPAIDMDEKEMRQLLLNLTRNGFEAMAPGGRLTIQTYTEKRKIVLVVRDTGNGIPQDLLEKLGTPFLTTKENGTGLGLAVCYRIAERHGAKIDVKTSPQGTVFQIIFPISHNPSVFRITSGA